MDLAPQDNLSRPSIPVWLQTPRSVYVHIPFCTQRCGYCNFALITGRDDLVDRYLDAIEIELKSQTAAFAQPIPIDTLFLGGGTPTYLSLPQIDRLFALLQKHFQFCDADNHRPFEATAEANPNDLSRQKVEHFAQHRINRFSVGAQSFQAKKLKCLERSHSASDIQDAAEVIHRAGAALSLDLIFAAPDESLVDWESDLSLAIACHPNHLSTYQLTFEKGTQFWNRLKKGRLTETEDDLALSMYQTAIQILTGQGFLHYEISNFALPNRQCHHNEAYWTGRSYFSFGPGAARYVAGDRIVNHSSTTTYIKKILNQQTDPNTTGSLGNSPMPALSNKNAVGSEVAASEIERYDVRVRATEYFIFGMRRLCGISSETFYHETGLGLRELFAPQIAKHVRLGNLNWNGERLHLTPNGLYISDSIWPDFL